MPSRKTTGKAASRPARQLLFREALQQTQPMAAAKGHQPEATPNITDAPKQDDTMERILQEISAIGRRLEGINSNISSLAEKTKSIRTDIPGFQTRLMGLEQRVSTIEDHLNTTPDRDQEIMCLRSKLIDLEERSHRDNVRFFRIPEQTDGTNIQDYLQKTFDPALKFQIAHHIGPKWMDGAPRPRPIMPVSCDTDRLVNFSWKLAPMVHSKLRGKRSES
ncbi:hypothetical protein NDU88_004394 [Pleurodeles waltl]|uniref:Uncharacterized protein n=1 Tax=Pleurodeles waltl TaxID=8319 RepID=A0AAV7NJN2_PLEWA|nr:hypothetical protein NDU88_004394 [Pleurodeles waltl]